MQAAAFRTSLPRAGAFSGSRVAVAPQRAALLAPTINRRGTVQVVAAEEQKKKRTPQPEKRAALALDRRSRNRSRKSAIATRTKKVCAIEGLNRESQCHVWFDDYSKIVQFVLGGRMVVAVHQHFSSNHITAAAAMLLGARAAGHCLLL
jgi:ribosomal protein S20